MQIHGGKGNGNGQSAFRPRRAFCAVVPLLMALGVAPQALAAGACGNRPCVSANSVVSAAGTEIRTAIEKLQFAGDALAPGSNDAIATIATTWAARSNKVLSFRVRADSGLQAAAARTQAAARAQALTRALVDAGLPGRQFKVLH